MLYWVDHPTAGRIGIGPRPRGHDWLADEIAAWRKDGVDSIVSCLEPLEARELGLADEERLCEAAGIQFLSHPIRDHSLPASLPATAVFVDRLAGIVGEKKSVGVHCFAGIGRSALIAAGACSRGGACRRTKCFR